MREPLKLLLQLAYVTSAPISVTKASQVAKPDMGQKSIISDRQALKTICRWVGWVVLPVGKESK